MGQSVTCMCVGGLVCVCVCVCVCLPLRTAEERQQLLREALTLYRAAAKTQER